MSSNSELMARRNAALPRGVSQGFPIFMDHADNAEMWDVEGRRYIDFAGGIAVLNVGNVNPHVTAAVQTQAAKLNHTCFMVTAYESYVSVCEKLNALSGIPDAKSFLVSTGAEAVENAVKVARAYTGRGAVIAFGGGFHGRTLLAMSLTGKVAPYKTGFGPFPTGIYHAAFPNALHGVSVDDSIASIEKLFKFDVDPASVAAIIVEPVQGEGGFVVAPKEFLERVRALCDAHGIVMIVDEVQAGAGRTGSWLAVHQSGVQPDVVTMAKSIGGGYPLAAVIGKPQIMEAPVPGGLGGTYGGNPVACAAALAVFEVFERDKLLERSRALGEQLSGRLHTLAGKHKSIVDVRGLGAMVAFELGEGGDVHKPAAALTKALVAKAFEKGLILLSCGTYANVIRVLVPLTAEPALVDEGLDIVASCLAELGA
ncbi:4-aminobutyrate--2-oxoglutarate transaminase [Plasticicumulans acidivorans]|uniref:4-aminobutyrate aminotransferase n=1 Tax=Plasticicumulans acidivorans TaxID=886464 RepID=A0A317MWW5_9GAMM|nr:4-aminobutyrate--2-oxoglutarate transaminase [Plasticicumulans acidivorans]PWV59459.1 4-aminobutyrate aminotransferase [Plasticicumulans acidivorans]